MIRPEPTDASRAKTIHRRADPRDIAQRLRRGERLVLGGRYGTGLNVVAELRQSEPPQDAPYQLRQRFKSDYRQAASQLLVPIEAGRIALAGAPDIGFLDDLYPQQQAFFLPFLDVQELHRAWQVYEDGVHLAVLGGRLHPFYGTYVPTRTSHLELFGTWLSQYGGAKNQAIDVGTGCGVLALMMAKAGFQRVLATDINPNALESLRRTLKTRPASIDLHEADLLDGAPKADVIAFNPPWTQGVVETALDRALMFEDSSLFERFFDQALDHLNPDGRVVLVFSNIIRLVQPEVAHPIETELERGRYRLVNKLQRKVKGSETRDGRARRTKERVEVWELAAT